MRVEVASVGKNKSKESSLALLSGLLLVCGLGYGASTPIIAEQLPPSMERALTNMRKDVDGLASSAMLSADQSYRNVAALISGR